jgi:DNA polymerase-1
MCGAMRKLFLVDGSGFIFRAYHALPPLTRPDGTPVGAVYGFCNMLSRFLGHLDGHKILVVFDAGRQTFRQDIYPQYKAHRPEAPEDLVPQFPLFREACLAFGVPTVEQGGFEADDLIASYTEFAKSQGLEVVIVSSDKDLMQLVGPGVTMLDPIKNKTIDESGVFEKFGVKPGQVVDVQALAGDSSDNVPGVPGIGIKTAAELINAYGSLEGLLAGAAAIKQPKRRESLIENADLARISKKLVTLIRDIPLPLALESLEINLVEGALKTFLEHQGFKTLAARLGANSGSGAGVITANTLQQTTPKNASKTLVTVEDIQAIAAQIKALGRCAIDLETTGLDFMKDRIVGVALAVEEEDSIVSAYIPLSHQTLEAQAPKAEALGIIKALCEDSTIVKIGHNIKFDMEFLRIEGIEVNTLEDTMVMSLC